MKKVLKIVDSINLKICYISMVALFLLMCMTTVDIIMRKTWLGIPDSSDFTQLFLALIIFGGFAYLESQRGHIRVEIVLEKLPFWPKKIIEGLMYLLSTGILFVLCYSLFNSISSNQADVTQYLRIPHWPFRIVVTIMLFMYAFTVLVHFIEIILRKKDKEEQTT